MMVWDVILALTFHEMRVLGWDFHLSIHSFSSLLLPGSRAPSLGSRVEVTTVFIFSKVIDCLEGKHELLRVYLQTLQMSHIHVPNHKPGGLVTQAGDCTGSDGMGSSLQP